MIRSPCTNWSRAGIISAHRFQIKGLAFEFEMDESLPKQAIGDEERITQIANNLLWMPMKFTDVGKIGLYVTRADDKLVLRVTDTGIGIPRPIYT